MMNQRMSIYDLDDFTQVINPHQRYVLNTDRKKSRAEIDGISAGRKKDPPTMDELFRTDNFYRDTKSLLVLFQLMGIMPIERVSAGKYLNYCLYYKIFFILIFQVTLNLTGFPDQLSGHIFYSLLKQFT